MRKLQALLLFTGLFIHSASAIEIVVDYSYDDNNFFASQESQDAMEAAADRFSRIITSSLAAVAPTGTATGTPPGWRIGFSHPATGAPYQKSTSANQGEDPFVAAEPPQPPADDYGFPGLTADVWILYAGGRDLGSSGIGGTATGLNFESTLNDTNGPMHRGFVDNTPSNTVNDLPRWGGSISFDTGRTWHFDRSTPPPFGVSDFYTIALHEIGHALGLATLWNQWSDNGAGKYTGVGAVSAYNMDNGTSATSLNLVSSANDHFKDNTYNSYIFTAGNPETVGVVPVGVRQDLLMDPVANFNAQQQRFELTNVDIAALRDLGWTTLATPVPGYRPDNTVGPSLFSAIGNNIYSTSARQTFNLVSRKARPVRAVIGVANDGANFDSINVSGTRGNSLFRVIYTSGGSNVTGAMIAGSFSTGFLSSASPPVQINVSIRPNKRKIRKVIRRRGKRIIRYLKRSRTLVVRSTSSAEPSATDLSVVRVRTR